MPPGARISSSGAMGSRRTSAGASSIGARFSARTRVAVSSLSELASASVAEPALWMETSSARKGGTGLYSTLVNIKLSVM